MTELRKVTRGQIRSVARKLGADQNGICPLCMNPLEFSTKGAVVVDHDHVTGEIRGALCRSCNAGEGKVFNAVGRWVVGKMDYALVIPALRRLADYLENSHSGLMYYNHKTEGDKRAVRAAREKARREAQKTLRQRAKEQAAGQ